MNLTESLENLGLNEKQAKVYIALLQIGQGSAYAIAKLSGLKKSTTYVVLEDLIDKGVVRKVPRVKVMQYIAIPPTELFAMAQAKLINAQKETLAELKALSSGDEHKMKVSYYEGVKELKLMYQKQLKEDNSQKYFGFYGKNENIPQELQEIFKKNNLKFKEREITREGVVGDGGIESVFGSGFKENKNYNSNIFIEVSENKTYIFSAQNLEGAVIDSAELAEALGQIFKMGMGDNSRNESGEDVKKVLV